MNYIIIIRCILSLSQTFLNNTELKTDQILTLTFVTKYGFLMCAITTSQEQPVWEFLVL